MRIKRFISFITIMLLVLVLSSCASKTNDLYNNPSSSPVPMETQAQVSIDAVAPISTTTESTSQPQRILTAQQPSAVSGKIQVTFIDVGQADSILIEAEGASMLIDAGNNGDGDTVVSYIKKQGITKLDYIIGTHPHEDHIGGMDNVIKSFDIGNIIMPKAQSTTKTFEDVLSAIASKGLKVNSPVPGTTYTLGDASFTIFAPNSTSYKNLNNYSVVIKLTYGNTSFLLDGDAEDVSESEMLNKGYSLKADVLKVGHHGSTLSTTDSFLKTVKPKYAIISVGAGNSYGHPASSTLSKLNNAGVQVFRTDESGTITVTSDGNAIKIDKSASPIKSQAPPVVNKPVVVNPTVKPNDVSDDVSNDVNVFRTTTGEKYHIDGCSYLSKSKILISLKDAKAKGLTPCSKCDPPQ